MVCDGMVRVEWIMQLIPVVDLSRGRAVQAREGDRARYEPGDSVLTPNAKGDPVALIRAYRETLGARQCYIADLDAIQGGEPQRAVLRSLAQAAAPARILVDAGIDDREAALEALELGATRVVVGLETLRSFEHLVEIVGTVGPERVVFSLDLRLGDPMVHPDLAIPEGAGTVQERLAALAIAAGTMNLLVLDVGRVGTGAGVEVTLLASLHRRFPEVRLIAGGGIRGRDDLERIREAGGDAALVASAFHSGRLGAEDVTELEGPAQSSASTSR